MRKEECPAYVQICDKYKGSNHFKVKCNKVNVVNVDGTSDSSDDEFWQNSVKQGSRENVKAQMTVNNCDVHFQLDCGVEVNTICKRYVRQEEVQPTKALLKKYDNNALGP